MDDQMKELDKVFRETPPDVDGQDNDDLKDTLDKMESELPDRYKALL